MSYKSYEHLYVFCGYDNESNKRIMKFEISEDSSDKIIAKYGSYKQFTMNPKNVFHDRIFRNNIEATIKKFQSICLNNSLTLCENFVDEQNWYCGDVSDIKLAIESMLNYIDKNKRVIHDTMNDLCL